MKSSNLQFSRMSKSFDDFGFHNYYKINDVLIMFSTMRHSDLEYSYTITSILNDLSMPCKVLWLCCQMQIG